MPKGITGIQYLTQEGAFCCCKICHAAEGLYGSFFNVLVNLRV